MPILPLDHPEPFTATVGVMLYPATHRTDPVKTRAFASQVLAEPIRRLHEAGLDLSYEALARIVMDSDDGYLAQWMPGVCTGPSLAEKVGPLLVPTVRPQHKLTL